MKLAIASTKPGLDGDIRRRLGENIYLLIVDSDSSDVEVICNPLTKSGHITSEIYVTMQLIVSDVQALLVDWCPEEVRQCIQCAGIQVFDGFQGGVHSAVEQARHYYTVQAGCFPHNTCDVPESYSKIGFPIGTTPQEGVS